jgi:hypothetical protein
VARWWRQEPEANVALACGPRFWVLDVDGEAGAASLAALQAEHGLLPDTLTISTGCGSFHAYFAANSRVRNSVRRLGAGLDTRSTGGYVVAPPSIHPRGTRYRVARRVPIAPAPEWLLDRLDPPRPEPVVVPFVRPADGKASRYAEAALRREFEAVACSQPGERNATLNKAAFALGQLAGAGLLDAGEIVAALSGAAAAAGLDPRETEKTLQSGLRGGMASPREVAQ